MVAKLFLLQFAIFRQYFIDARKIIFTVATATAQIFCWLSSFRQKISKFRYKIVLLPSHFTLTAFDVKGKMW